MLKLRLKKEELLKGVSQTQSIAEKRSSMPILSNLLLDVHEGQLAITATDLEITFRGTYEAEIIEEGRITVPARKFFEIVRILGDEQIYLEETDNYNLVLEGARSKYQLHGLSPEDFPPMPEYEGVNFIDVPSDKLMDMIDKTIHSIAVEETRYNLAGVFFEKMLYPDKGMVKMVSTDGHRLSLAEKEMENLDDLEMEKGVIISKKGVAEMKKMAETVSSVKMGFTGNSGVVLGDRMVLVTRLLEGRFPDYNMVIPKKNNKVMSTGRKDLLDMMRRVSVMSSDDFKAVKFSLAAKELTLIAVNPDIGEARDSLPVEYEGDLVEVGFNPRYFIEALSSLKSDIIEVSLLDQDHPCKLTAPEEKGFIGVIMPMKI